ncbi:unnamed protein product [Ambrosiozyma monospora]|uniref:Unnamed protein product n=1 Tax=Ambrosiozyma monospora TaxID=43982 RepID=A0ACB5TD15_AMBMO|nr:unnamed protein product [Ambrosiozyma monospora]
MLLRHDTEYVLLEETNLEKFWRLNELELRFCLQDVNHVIKTVSKWKKFILSNPEKKEKGKPLKLIIDGQFCNVTSAEDEKIRVCIRNLIKLITKNKDILSAYFLLPHVRPFFSHETLVLYSTLIDICDLLKASCVIEVNTLDNLNWMFGISRLESIDLEFDYTHQYGSNFFSNDMRALKHLSMIGYVIDALFLEKVPDTLQSLEFNMDANGDFPIRLPSHLKKWGISTTGTPRTSNKTELNNLTDLKANFFKGKHDENSDHHISDDIFERIQSFISYLPSSVTTLNLSADKELKQQVSFVNLPGLETLRLRYHVTSLMTSFLTFLI